MMIEFLEQIQKWFYDPAGSEPPDPSNRFSVTPVSQLPKGRAGLAIRNAELFIDRYSDEYFRGHSEELFQWLICHSIENLIQDLIEHAVEGDIPPTRIKGADIIKQCQIAESTLTDWLKRSDFPKPIEGITPRVFDLAEVNAWLRERGKPMLELR